MGVGDFALQIEHHFQEENVAGATISVSEDKVVTKLVRSIFSDFVSQFPRLSLRDKRFLQLSSVPFAKQREIFDRCFKRQVGDIESVIIDFAKILAEYDTKGLVEHIGQFGIKDEKALIDIAKICAERDPEGVSQWIDNFGIKNEEALKAINPATVHKTAQLTAESVSMLCSFPTTFVQLSEQAKSLLTIIERVKDESLASCDQFKREFLSLVS